MFSIGKNSRLPSERECGKQPNRFSPLVPALNSFLDENLALEGDSTPPVLIDSGDVNGNLVDECGQPLSLLLGHTSHPSELPLISGSDKRALQQLVSQTIPQDELLSVVETIALNVKAANLVGCLQPSDAQTFIDVIDQAGHHIFSSLKNWLIDLCSNLLIPVNQALNTLDFAPRIQRKCMKLLYKMCAGHVMIPRSLNFELCGDTSGTPLCRGGSADVSRCDYNGQVVAVKVLRMHGSLQDMTNVSHWWAFVPLYMLVNQI